MFSAPGVNNSEQLNDTELKNVSTTAVTNTTIS